MADFIQLVAVTPAVTPATDAVTYDKFWMTQLMVMSRDPNQPTRLRAELKPARDITVDGVATKEIQPDGQSIVLTIDDVFGRAGSNPSFAAALEAVLEQVLIVGVEQGVLVDPSATTTTTTGA